MPQIDSYATFHIFFQLIEDKVKVAKSQMTS